MFDIAASELIIIAVVALIVIGPERLPRFARTVGHLFGRMQRYVSDVKADIQREVELDELRKLKETVEESARSIETTVNREIDAAREEVRDLESLVQAQETVPQPSAGAPTAGDASQTSLPPDFHGPPLPAAFRAPGAPAPAPAPAAEPAASLPQQGAASGQPADARPN